MYQLISNILALPVQNVNSNVVQAAIAILVLCFIIVLRSLFAFFNRIFSIR